MDFDDGLGGNAFEIVPTMTHKDSRVIASRGRPIIPPVRTRSSRSMIEKSSSVSTEVAWVDARTCSVWIGCRRLPSGA